MRKYLYPTLVFSFLAIAAAIFFFKKPVAKMPELLDRRGSLAAGGEWVNTKNAIQGLLAKLRQDPNDHKSRLLLAQAYMQEGRVTGNHAYYDAAAMELLNQVLAADANNFEALCCKATLSLTQHHFAQGLELAKRAREINPNSGFVYGLLTDAYVELGQYDEAIKNADKMNQVRPDLTAYARVSYLREIHGDIPGAIEAMRMAVQAGYVGLEQTEWTRVALGHLYEISGDLPKAENCYQQALVARPAYAYAMAGLGRVAAARGNYPEAIRQLQQARGIVKDYAFTDELVDVYRLAGQPAKAKEMADESVQMLAIAAEDANSNEELGHYTDRELAYAYLKTGELDKALEHARIEYDRRPDNIDVNETLAWVYYKRGDFANAQKYMQVARRTNSQTPTLLCRAGLILLKNGQAVQGQELINKALATMPYLDPELAKESKQLVAAR